MTTINDMADLARILREQPEWAEAVRSLVLSKELLELPDRFVELANRVDALAVQVAELTVQVADLTSRVDSLTVQVAELTSRVDSLTVQLAALAGRFAEFVELTNRNFETVNRRLDNLESDMAEVKSRLGNVEVAVNQVNGRLDNGLGMNYEFRIGRNLGSIANQHLDVRRVRALSTANQGSTPEFIDLIDDAQDQGLITREQSVDVQRLDLVFRGQRSGDNAPVLVAAEISITVGDSDITRAAERGALLEQASQMPVLAAVVCSRIDEQRTALAEVNGVAVILFPDE